MSSALLERQHPNGWANFLGVLTLRQDGGKSSKIARGAEPCLTPLGKKEDLETSFVLVGEPERTQHQRHLGRRLPWEGTACRGGASGWLSFFALKEPTSSG